MTAHGSRLTLPRGRPRSAPGWRPVAGLATILVGGLAVGAILSAQPLVALAVPLALVSALVVSRYPAGAVILVFAVSGTYGSITAFTPVSPGQFTDVLLAGLCIGVVLGYLVKGHDRPAWLWPGVVGCALYIALTALEVLTAESLRLGLESFRASTWYMLAFLLIAYAGWRPAIHERIARGIVAVALLVGAYATLRWVIGPAGAERDLANQIAGDYNIVNGHLRVFGSFVGGHQLGFWTATAIPFCLAFALTFSGRWRVAAGAACLLCTLGLVASEVRAGVAGLIVGVAVVLILYQLSRGFPGLHFGGTALALVAVLGTGGLLYSLTVADSESTTNRYSAILNPSQDPAYQQRLFKWDSALEDIDDHPLGQGLGTAGRTERNFGRFKNIALANLDNSYLKIAYEQGFAVMVFFIVSILLVLYGLARRAVLTTQRNKAGLAIGASGALASFLVVLYSGVYIEDLIALCPWVIAGIGIAQFTSSDPGEESHGDAGSSRRAEDAAHEGEAEARPEGGPPHRPDRLEAALPR